MTTVSVDSLRCNHHPISPVAIRDDVVVRVGGLPLDLTGSEADRIARIIRAHIFHHVDASEKQTATDCSVIIDGVGP